MVYMGKTRSVDCNMAVLTQLFILQTYNLLLNVINILLKAKGLLIKLSRNENIYNLSRTSSAGHLLSDWCAEILLWLHG